MEWSGTAQFWVIVAALALTIELFTVSFFFFFLCIGAGVTALLTWLSVTPGGVAQLLCFTTVSLGSTLLFRRYAMQIFRKNEKVGEYRDFIGDRATVSVAIPAGGEGRIKYRGTEWIAMGEHNAAIAEGAQVIVKRMEGIKTVVEEIT